MPRPFHEQLAQLKTEVQRLGARVIELIPRGTQALLDGDLQTAEEIVDADDDLDQKALAAEEHCYQLLVYQAPMASDLRAVLAAIRMISEIERSGDLMVNVCKAARRLYGVELDPRLRGLIGRMSEQAQVLFRFAMEAYAEDDAPLAAALHDMDDNLDLLQREFVSTMFRLHEEGRVDLQTAVQLALVCRFYERIGDHAVNIGERVEYLVNGTLPDPHHGDSRRAAPE